jgi:hypothetical protein
MFIMLPNIVIKRLMLTPDQRDISGGIMGADSFQEAVRADETAK